MEFLTKHIFWAFLIYQKLYNAELLFKKRELVLKVFFYICIKIHSIYFALKKVCCRINTKLKNKSPETQIAYAKRRFFAININVAVTKYILLFKYKFKKISYFKILWRFNSKYVGFFFHVFIGIKYCIRANFRHPAFDKFKSLEMQEIQFG